MMKLRTHFRAACALALIAGPLLGLAPVLAHDSHDGEGYDPSRPDSHAPLHIMGDHTHRKGEWMFSYRYMHMDMSGESADHDHEEELSIGQGAASAGKHGGGEDELHMVMHMVEAMYAPTDRLTLMAMVPYVDMDGHEGDAVHDIGDVMLAGLVKVHDSQTARIHFNIGASLPTGTEGAPHHDVHHLMQTGTGTYGAVPGVTWLGQASNYSWGGQLQGHFYFGEDDKDTAPGDRIDLAFWGARRLGARTSLSLGLDYADWDGAKFHAHSHKSMVVAPELASGSRIEAGLGLNFKLARGNRVGLDIQVPIHEDIEEGQLEMDVMATLGWQKSF